MAIDLSTLREAVQELVLRQSAQAWQAWYGAAPWDPAAELAERFELFEPEAVGVAQDAGDALLARHLVWQSVALRTRPAVERYLRARSTVAVRQADRTLFVAEVGRTLGDEVDRDLRRRLWDDFVPVLRLSAPAFLGVIEATAEAGRAHGFDDGFSLACALTRIEPAEAVAAAEAVLAQTETDWREALELAADLVGVPPDDIRPYDLSHILRPDEHEVAFAADGALPLAGATFAKLGLDLTGQTGVETLEDPRGESGRSPRAFPLAVPGDVRIGALPQPGLSWLREFFNELGRAQHLAHTAAGPVTETFPLGLRGVTDAAGRLVAGWLSDPLFLTANGMPPTPASALAGHARLAALHEARTVAAATLWHHDLATAGVATLADAAEAWVARAPIPPTAEDADALPDRLDAVFALDSLQLRLHAAAHEAALRDAHGERWWWSEDAGAALFSAWSAGQRRPATTWVREHLGASETLGSAAELL